MSANEPIQSWFLLQVSLFAVGPVGSFDFYIEIVLQGPEVIGNFVSGMKENIL